MGLCKCPKRKVTNQFCFEHRVCVCEFCMVSNHTKCIIQSYLKWLQDAECNPICELCMKELVSEDCIRLTCYHVFHWGCLDRYSRQLPATTAPAGYTCPSCRTALFPPRNLVSPVADVLREKLAGVNWARAGLGLPLLSEDREIKPSSNNHVASSSGQSTPVASTSNVTPPYSVVHVKDDQVSFNRDKNEIYQAARRSFQDVRETQGKVFDHDDDKYKRRPPAEWMRRWWKNALGVQPQRRGPSSIYKRYIMLALLIILTVVGVLIIMSRLGHYYTENDPSLKIENNRNIIVQHVLPIEDQKSM